MQTKNEYVCLVSQMDINSDCVYQILRRVGSGHMAACAVVCKQWKRAIFQARIPIVVFSRAGVVHNDIADCTVFTAFVRNKRGYTRCIVTKIPLNYFDIPVAVYDVYRGGSKGIELVHKNFEPQEHIDGIYGNYKVFSSCAREIRSMWPDYDELAAVLGAVNEFSG